MRTVHCLCFSYLMLRVPVKQCFSTAEPRHATGPYSYEKKIYQAAVSQKSRTIALKFPLYFSNRWSNIFIEFSNNDNLLYAVNKSRLVPTG